jgi:hypothetical protein
MAVTGGEGKLTLGSIKLEHFVDWLETCLLLNTGLSPWSYLDLWMITFTHYLSCSTGRSSEQNNIFEAW